MQGKLTSPEIEQILQNQLIGRIGCSLDGKTYIVPIAFAYDGKYLYGHSQEGTKIRIMRLNPKICFEVDEIIDMGNWRSVIVQGDYEELFGEAARDAIQFFIKKIKPHIISERSVSSHGLGQFHLKDQSSIGSVVFRVCVKEKSGRFEKRK